MPTRIKYQLGVHFTDRLNWKMHWDYVKDCTKTREGAVRSMVRSYEASDPLLVRVAGYCIMASMMEFASAVWATNEAGSIALVQELQKSWHAVGRTALMVHGKTPGAFLRGELGPCTESACARCWQWARWCAGW